MILIIEDDIELHTIIKDYLNSETFEIRKLLMTNTKKYKAYII